MKTTLTDLQKKLRLTALNLLARRDHTSTELSKKLQTRDFPLETIEALIIQLQKEGLLNNTRFSENFIYHRRNKGLGPTRIKAELNARGIPDSVIEEDLDITDNAWMEILEKTWQKRFKNTLPTDFKTHAKQMRFLQYRGFTQDQIEKFFRGKKA